MGRAPKFTEDQFLDAALQLVAVGGPGAATVAAVAETLGAPVGSVYHRFDSRDLLLAKLWLRTTRRFQVGLLEALANDDPDEAALSAALHVNAWAREHLDEARALLLYRREDLTDRWPAELGDEAATVNAALFDTLRDLASRRYGSVDPEYVQRVTYAVLDAPYAAGRRHLLAGEAPPPIVDDLVTVTCRCVLADGD
ncbi:TetR/AcrR family transcriptional regulator [Streptomyces sp. NRRL WC-3742]|uniref:TetR/AcrR family transcriptional regulator n=1 Tax=Streptomyces sp. NRRL WC-3742 TaxID=1463934 RepID=UPI0005607F6B|nr:TetR/AcrR family transcriptional regulator [Streptomyces sp. NRRL WC-3742]